MVSSGVNVCEMTSAKRCKGGQILDLSRPNVGIGSMFGLVIISLLGSMGEGGGTMRPYRNKTTPCTGFFFLRTPW